MKFISFVGIFMLELSLGNSNLVSLKILHILHDFFPSCEIIFVTIREHNLTSTAAPPNSLLPFEYTQSAGNYIAQFNGDKDEVVTFRRLQDVHKFLHGQCGVALLYISRISPTLPKWLFETVTPRYVPIIRKDVDHFIFVFNRDNDAEEILTSYDFGQKVKFKLGIVYRGDERQPLFSTVQLYANKGLPVVKPLDIDLALQNTHTLFPDTTRNLYGKLLRVVKVAPNCHFEMEPLPNGKGNRPVRGFYKVWLDVMMEQFNFTIHLRLASLKGSTGKLFPNKTWQGATGDILYDKADLGVYVGHIYDRHPHIDWSTPLSYEWMVLITHKPRTFYSPSAIIRPFPLLLWLGFILSLLSVCLALKWITKVYPVQFTYGSSFRYLLATFLEQDASHYMCIIKLGPVRMIIAFWLLFALVLSTAYRGKLVSLIAFPATTWVPATMDDLAFSHYRAGVNLLGKGGASYTIFSTSEHPVYKRIFEKMEAYYDAAQCLKEGLTHDIGCIMWVSVAGYNVYRNFTDQFGRTPFKASTDTTSFLEDGYIWEKRALFAQNFNKITWAIVERGLASFWTISDFNAEKKKNLEWQRLNPGNASFIQMDNEEGPSKLQIVHLTGLLFLSLTGLVLSLITLIFEMYKEKGGRCGFCRIQKGWIKQDLTQPKSIGNYSNHVPIQLTVMQSNY